ncbi:signal peptidase I [Fictibacillus barbaricus]|uniref:Signal peptidase I n=1 Tax=Fictibacillus barbaricus TaxID=182136 RepID=A0ABU1U1W3_9BACL|nr:signal peptidase I [Fictibacillus barbaricus]MDR7073351.1 signal peptidase [Fictibacillus barbaricus]
MQVNQVTVDLIRRVLKEKGNILLPANGKSMFPFIRQGDICHFKDCHPSMFKKGDVILFVMPPNQLVAHRFIKRIHVDNRISYLFKGDTNLLFDEPVLSDQIIGKMTMIERRKKLLDLNNNWSNIWGLLIIHLPMMSKILRKVTYRKEDFQY